MEAENFIANGFVVKASPWTKQNFDKDYTAASDEQGNVYVLSGTTQCASTYILWKSDPDLEYWESNMVRLDKKLECHQLLRVWKEKLYVWNRNIELVAIDLKTDKLTVLKEFPYRVQFVHSDAFEDKLYFFEVGNRSLERYWTFSLRDTSWKVNPVTWPGITIDRPNFGDSKICLWQGEIYVQGNSGLRKYESCWTAPKFVFWRNQGTLCNSNGYLCHAGCSFTEIFSLGSIRNPFFVESAFTSKNRLYVLKTQSHVRKRQRSKRNQKPHFRFLFGYVSFRVLSLRDITIRKVSQCLKPDRTYLKLFREIGCFASLFHY